MLPRAGKYTRPHAQHLRAQYTFIAPTAPTTRTTRITPSTPTCATTAVPTTPTTTLPLHAHAGPNVLFFGCGRDTVAWSRLIDAQGVRACV